MLNQIKVWGIQQVLWAERTLKGKTGAEKKAAVIQKLDELIVLPSYLEWADDLFLSWLVDLVCSKFNALAGHNFGDVNIDSEQEKEFAEVLNAPAELVNSVQGNSFSQRLSELFKAIKGN